VVIDINANAKPKASRQILGSAARCRLNPRPAFGPEAWGAISRYRGCSFHFLCMSTAPRHQDIGTATPAIDPIDKRAQRVVTLLEVTALSLDAPAFGKVSAAPPDWQMPPRH
jgi:hypothetical protein